MKMINQMKYRDWQKRNSGIFATLTNSQQKEARNLGYYNNGWSKVISSWDILCQLKSPTDIPSNVSSLFDHKLRKGDLVGAIDISIIEADQAKELAATAIKSLETKQQYLDQLTDAALAKYTLL